MLSERASLINHGAIFDDERRVGFVGYAMKKIGSASQGKPVWFDELSMKEAGRMAKIGKTIIIPIGSVEEHGDHLPLCTDSIQPEYVALEVARRKHCFVAPPLRYGVCSSARNFPGTVSISFEALHKIVLDVLEEFVRNGFQKILVLSGHAGQSHMTALRLAAEEVITKHAHDEADKMPRIMVCSDYDFAYELKGRYFSDKDGHAGTIETSRVMSIRPDLVKSKGKRSYPQLPRFELVAHPERYFPSGVIGDPTTASKKKGQTINEYVIENVAKLIDELRGEATVPK
jgi:creatinine amidohydrolase